jgi:ParB-like nuclease domain
MTKASNHSAAPVTVKVPVEWTQRDIPVNLIDLDPQNSRLLTRERLGQKQILEKLIAQEEVLELARSIIKDGGIHPHESIIVVKKEGRYLVVEGNRRSAAIKIILNPSLLPPKQQGRISDVPIPLKKKLANLPAKIAPSIADAAPLISALHTKNAKRSWSAAAKAFHIGRLADQGLNVTQIAKAENLKEGIVKKALLSHRLLGIAETNPDLNEQEMAILRNPRLKVNPFTRVFTLGWMSKRFPIKINDDGKIEHKGFHAEETRRIVNYMARNLLLPAEGGKPRYDTRTPEGTILGEIEAKHKDIYDIINKYSKPTAATTLSTATIPPARAIPNKSLKKHDYFQGLYPGKIKNNDALVQAIVELTTIDIGRFPSSALFLQRTVTEGCLAHAMKELGLWGDYMSTQKDGKYGLDSLVEYCKINAEKIWRNPKDFRQHLGDWGRSKFLADKTAHALIRGSATLARDAATHIRPIIEGILREDYK